MSARLRCPRVPNPLGNSIDFFLGKENYPRQMMGLDFYRAFEDKHRGSHDVIKSRLSIYLDFIDPLKHLYQSFEGVDLGCGRGEWLELLKDSGGEISGVDLDEGMLKACRERGLKATSGEAIFLLKKSSK